MMKMKKILLTFLFFTVSVVCFAVDDMTTAQIQVPDYSQASRDKALPQILDQVLVKVTGNANVKASQSDYNQITSMLESYSYDTNQQGKNTIITLRAKFNPEAIKQLLSQTKQAVWSENRPVVVSAIVVDNGINVPSLIVANDAYSKILSAEANKMGLTINIPQSGDGLLDKVNVDAKSFDPNIVTAIVSKYRANAVLIGRVSLQSLNNGWIGKFALVSNKGTADLFTINGSNSDTILVKAMDQVVQQFTKPANNNNNLAASQSINEITLLLTAVGDLDKYAEAVKYLKKMNGVIGIDTSSLENQQVKLIVKTRLSAEELMSAINSSNKIVVNKAGPTDPADVNLVGKIVNLTVMED
jgi:hypothetical protein